MRKETTKRGDNEYAIEEDNGKKPETQKQILQRIANIKY